MAGFLAGLLANLKKSLISLKEACPESFLISVGFNSMEKILEIMLE